VPSPTEPFAPTGTVRDAIDPRRFPWIRPLVSEYTRDFERVAALFAGNPADASAWKQTIDRVTRASRDRATVVAALTSQQTRRSAPTEAMDASSRLALRSSVAIVTGQQAGVFGGPLYTLFKAVTAIQLARQVRAAHGVEAVPVFWVDTEDHDWEEVRAARILDRDGSIADVVLPDMPGAGQHSVARIVLDGGVTAALDRLAGLLAPSEFTTDVLATLGRRYRPGAPAGAAFAGWLEDLLGRHGLVVFEADDPSLKPLVADIFAAELDSRPTSRLAREAGRTMAGLGHAPQVEPADDAVAVFYLDGDGRRGIRARGDQYSVGDALRPAASLTKEALDHPERFSPNVLLRPIVQDRLFPTAAYVAGPAELAYQAQLLAVYREFGVEPPLLYSRTSATLLDGAAMRFLERSGLPLESLHGRDDAVLNKWLSSQLPAEIEQSIEETDRLVIERVNALKDAVASIDPTLTGAADTTRDKMRETLKTLHGKVVQAAKRKDDTLRRQFHRTRALAFPEGDPQERSLNVAFFVNRYGLGLGDRLVEALPVETDKHYVLTL
jgi:bacillithiol biosynthesis cysteine-adding enzyme BshC